MKNHFFKLSFINFLFFILLISYSCTTKHGEMPSSSGKTCEILIVADKSAMKSEIGDSLRAFFMKEQDGLNQPEPLFTLPNIPYSSFENTDMFQTHRNIIIVNINDSCKTKMDVIKNFKAKPQLIFELNAPNKEAFLNLLSEKKILIKGAFDEMERTRINAAFKAVEKIEIRNVISKNFKFSLVFPSEFEITKKTSDFAWIRKEAKDFSQGIIIYTFPYTDKKDLEPEKIIALRDSLTKQWIPGPAEGSYMTTEKEFKPYFKEINFNGLYAIESRGLWRLQGDFMGGPFINYTFVDEKNNRIIMLDGYLYSPKKPKRDLLKQIESIIYTYKAL